MRSSGASRDERGPARDSVCDWGTRPSDPGWGRPQGGEGGPGDLVGDVLPVLSSFTEGPPP